MNGVQIVKTYMHIIRNEHMHISPLTLLPGLCWFVELVIHTTSSPLQFGGKRTTGIHLMTLEDESCKIINHKYTLANL